MDLTVIVIKPDAVRDVLEGQIINDFVQKVDFEILFAKYHRFNYQQVVSMYPDWKHKEVFPDMVRNLTFGDSLILLVRGNESSKKIAEVKGKMNIGGGLRNKYRRQTVEWMMQMGYPEHVIRQLKAENRMHSTDTTCEALEIMSLVCSNQEIMTISGYFTEALNQEIIRV